MRAKVNKLENAEPPYKVPTTEEFLQFIHQDMKALLREMYPEDFGNSDEQSLSA